MTLHHHFLAASPLPLSGLPAPPAPSCPSWPPPRTTQGPSQGSTPCHSALPRWLRGTRSPPRSRAPRAQGQKSSPTMSRSSQRRTAAVCCAASPMARRPRRGRANAPRAQLAPSHRRRGTAGQRHGARGTTRAMLELQSYKELPTAYSRLYTCMITMKTPNSPIYIN